MRQRRPELAYGLAVLATVAAFGLAFLLPFLALQCLLFLGAVILTIRYGGWRPSLLATALSTLSLTFFTFTSRAALPAEYLFTPVLFLAGALTICYTIESVFRRTEAAARRFMEQQRRMMQEQIEYEVNLQTAELRQSNQALAAGLEKHEQMAEVVSKFQAEYHHLFENANDAILIFAPETQLILECNNTACGMYGFRREELVGMSLRQLTQDAAHAQYQVAELLQHGTHTNFETIHLRHDGTPIHVVANSSLVEYRGVKAILSINRDVTAQKRYEEERAQFVLEQTARAEAEAARARIESILESITDAFFALDRSMRFTYVNGEAERLLGRDKGRLFDRKIWDEFPDAIGSAFQANFQQAIETQSAREFETFYPPRRRWLEVRAYPSQRGLSVYLSDITDRKRSEEAVRQSEEALRASQQRLHLAHKAAHISSWEWNVETQEIKWSEGSGSVYGVEDHELGSTYHDWLRRVHPEDRNRITNDIQRALDGGPDIDTEFRINWPDVSVHWLATRAQVFRADTGKPLRVIGIDMDVTGRKRAEDALYELASIVESCEDAIIGKNLDGVITTWNTGAEKMFGYTADEVVGLPIATLMPRDRSDYSDQLRRGETVKQFETVGRRKDGTTFNIFVTVSPIRNAAGTIIGVSRIARDITDQKRVEQALRLNERLAATGRLAATIAHEINNPMATLTDIIYLLDKELTGDKQIHPYVEIAKQEVARISHITTHMLSLYRESAKPVPVRIPEVVESALALYSRKIEARNIHVHLRNGVDGIVQAFPAEMRQVFSNLIVNALEAAPANGTVRLHVSHSCDWKNPQTRGVRVAIADDGCGIAPENRRRLFQPFFTTKGEKGTGLGLWVSNGIIQKHGGSIRVRSSVAPGRSGTCFSVFLPSMHLTQASIADEPTARAS
ncbi:MAG TPA: PAS domain S-box protein [Terriglobales bacterium]|nr:PAS domain S-box protein [Terriglobales bacterium]